MRHNGRVDWYVDGTAAGAMTHLRHDVVDYLRRHAAGPEGIDEAELVVSEVTGNAVRHAAEQRPHSVPDANTIICPGPG